MLNRRKFLLNTAAIGAGLAWRNATASTGSINWPAKPVRVIVPFTPGGSTDIAARVISAKLTLALGQTFVVENKAGAGGNIGLQSLGQAAADGYTIGIVTTAHTINTTLTKQPGYNLLNGFTPIALIQEGPLVLVANNDLPVNSLEELIAYGKKNPGVLNYASSGTGNSTHMAGALFSLMTGIKMTHVPYRGSAPSITDTIAGVCQISFDTMLSALPHIQTGKLKALAVTSQTRTPELPNVPTVRESGFADYEVTAWNGLTAPAGTPASVIARINVETVKALENEEVKTRFAQLGATVRATTPEEFAAFIAADAKKWAKVIHESNITIS